MGPLSPRWIFSLVVGAAALGLSAPAAQAQYFGRNKVQYEDFDFKVLKTEHFDIYYYPEVQVEYVALIAERWYARLSRLLDHELSDRQKLIVYASHPHFEQTNALQGVQDEGTQGVTELFKRRIVLPMLGPLKETDHVIGHELTHAFQFDITGNGGGTLISGVPGAARMPLWFVEGMAEYLSVGPVDTETSMWIRALVSQDKPPEEITDPRFLHPYQHGQALWAYIGGRWGDDVIGRILKATRTTPSVAAAFQRVLRVMPSTLLSQWYDEMRAAAEPLVSQTDRASAFGTPILGRATGSGAFNISPAISPDGNDVVYLSEKDLFAIEMFRSDAHTGKVEKKIVKASLDPHFEGLQFVNSAGSWSHDGTKFTFAAVRKGHPSISVMDTDNNKIIKEKIFPDLGEIYNPAWSPDGRYIVFSALSGGLSDLFIYDTQEDDLRRLTNDAYGDMHPVWSPDGRQIAFVTDRFTTGLSSLMYGNYTLASLDPRTGAIREIPAFDKGKHINPQWSPDGSSLYFISDQNGVSNVYRRDMETGEIFQITNLFTGVAGI
ncbi:MAG: peptidase S9, partial [Gemmatimonadales bacterium]